MMENEETACNGCNRQFGNRGALANHLRTNNGRKGCLGLIDPIEDELENSDVDEEQDKTPDWAKQALEGFVKTVASKEAESQLDKVIIKNQKIKIKRLEKKSKALENAKEELQSELRLVSQEQYKSNNAKVLAENERDEANRGRKIACDEKEDLCSKVTCTICFNVAMGPHEKATAWCSDSEDNAHPMCSSCVVLGMVNFAGDHSLFEGGELSCNYNGCTHAIPDKYLMAAGPDIYTKYANAKYAHQVKTEEREAFIRQQGDVDTDSQKVAEIAVDEFLIEAAKLRTPCCGKACELKKDCCTLFCDYCHTAFCGWCFGACEEDEVSHAVNVHDHIRFDCEHNPLKGLDGTHPVTGKAALDRGYDNTHPQLFIARHKVMQEEQVAAAKAKLLQRDNPPMYIHS